VYNQWSTFANDITACLKNMNIDSGCYSMRFVPDFDIVHRAFLCISFFLFQLYANKLYWVAQNVSNL